MVKAPKAMESDVASDKKLAGHKNERHFAEVIGGRVQVGSQKADVVDAVGRFHSVKGATWWQMFLYSENRFRTDINFQKIGNVANIMVDCLNVYPPTFADYKLHRLAVKQALRPHMVRLLKELQDPAIFKAFLDKAIFDGENVDFLSVFSGRANTPKEHKHYHIFHKDDVIWALQRDVTPINSQARGSHQVSEQKVAFPSAINGTQIGEIEVRSTKTSYRRMRFRLNSAKVMRILQGRIRESGRLTEQVTAYGRAMNPMSNVLHKR